MMIAIDKMQFANEAKMTEQFEANGIRVVMVMNRKGGCGKSTLVKALTSAAIANGENVTVFDTDSSESSFQWMLNAKEQGNWNDRAAVINAKDLDTIESAIDEIYERPDQEHLILIDTFGGASEVYDELASQSHLIVVPSMLSRSDVTETVNTLMWHQKLKSRVEDASAIPPISVLISRVPYRRSKADEETISEIIANTPAVAEQMMNRDAYQRMDLEGLLGEIAGNANLAPVIHHLNKALDEAKGVLKVLDNKIKGVE